jgi:hypothetical protein
MIKQTLIKLFEAQDIVRLLWAEAGDKLIQDNLRILDKEITKTINKIGKS